MNFKFIFLFLMVFIVSSCKEEHENRQMASVKDIKKRELIFDLIQKSWIFNAKPVNETSQSLTQTWNEWRIFLTELDKKPKKTIGAFQKKSADLSSKALALSNGIPLEFDKPQIKARLAILITKVRMLDLYIHLKEIPDKKVVALIPEINVQLIALQNQMDKIIQKSKIPLEEGESDLIKMLDPSRAIPNSPQLDSNTSRVE
jgi:hypothetical protein